MNSESRNARAGRPWQRGAAAGVMVLMLAAGGCAVGPNYEGPPKADVPGSFAQLPGEDTALDVLPVQGAADVTGWWSKLGDTKLDDLIDRAYAANLDLRVATARVAEARARRGVTAADQFPSVDATAGYSRSRNSDNTQAGRFSGGDADGTDLYQAGFDAVWELDFWGRIRRNVEAADADLDAAVEDRRDVLITLLAEVARNYVELRAAQGRLRVAESAVRVQEDTLAIVDSRFKAGVSSELDTSQAKAQLDVRRSQVPPLRASIEQTIHRLSVLIGQSPAALQQELRPAADIPVPPDRVAVGVPSELLLRRPDVRRAERRIAAATARVGVAEAEFFPRFTLTAGLGLESDQIGNFPEMNSRYWSIGPGMRWPIFNAGRIQFNVDAQRAVVDQAAATYEGVVLSSFEEVENALVDLVQEQARFTALNDAVVAAKRSVDLADERYRAGTVDFRTVLDNQRTLYETEDQMVQSRRSVSTSVIALYKALGGGWEIDAQKDGKRPDSEAERPANPATRAEPAPAQPAPVEAAPAEAAPAAAAPSNAPAQ